MRIFQAMKYSWSCEWCKQTWWHIYFHIFWDTVITHTSDWRLLFEASVHWYGRSSAVSAPGISYCPERPFRVERLRRPWRFPWSTLEMFHLIVCFISLMLELYRCWFLNNLHRRTPSFCQASSRLLHRLLLFSLLHISLLRISLLYSLSPKPCGLACRFIEAVWYIFFLPFNPIASDTDILRDDP